MVCPAAVVSRDAPTLPPSPPPSPCRARSPDAVPLPRRGAAVVRVSTNYGGVTFMVLLDDDQGLKAKDMVARVTGGLDRFIQSPDARTTMGELASLFQGALLPVSWRAFAVCARWDAALPQHVRARLSATMQLRTGSNARPSTAS